MTFRRLTEHQKSLRTWADEFDKEAGPLGLAGKAVAAPFKAVGSAMYQSSKRFGGPIAGPLMFGAGVLGTAGMAGHALGKSREYRRGFDPRIQEAKLKGQRF